MEFKSEVSREVWEQNYLYSNESDITDTWKRVAENAASVELDRDGWSQKFYDMQSDFKVVPGGRVYANIGTNRGGATLFNCFVHHPRDLGHYDIDSIDGIFDMLKAQALTLKSEGGYGTNFSWLRPNGTFVRGIEARTPGVVKFMELWDKSSEIITMGTDMKFGTDVNTEKKKSRKGAMMAVLSVWHPDIIGFIKAKQVPNYLTKFNMSVGITKGFMDAVKNDLEWTLRFPDTTHSEYKFKWNGNIDDWEELGYPVVVYKTIKATDLWGAITESTYLRNEPGIIFLDTVNKLNPLAYSEQVEATNPCGEIPMSTGVCNLASINLTQFVKDSEFDFKSFKQYVGIAIRFLDNINDISNTPLPEYSKSVQDKRRIGLGVMGLGSMFYMLGIKYGSPESVELTKQIYKTKAEAELIASADIGAEKGSFKLFDADNYFKTYWWKTLRIDDSVKQYVERIGCMRNSHRSMNAPTGNTGILANIVSGGIEPVFMKEYYRWMIVGNDERRDFSKHVEMPDYMHGEWRETDAFKLSRSGDEDVLVCKYNGTDYQIDKNRGLTKKVFVQDYGYKYVVDNSLPYSDDVFATSQDISVDDHIAILAVASLYTDMNNSKTVNIPNNYSYSDFKDVYMKAYNSNIKGMTTYRDGTMTAVLEAKRNVEDYQSDLDRLIEESNGNIIKDNVKLPDEYHSKGFIIKDKNKKKWYFHVAFADSKYKKPFAIFVSTNHRETTEVASEIISSIEKLAIDSGIDHNIVYGQSDKYSGQSNVVKIVRVIGLVLRHNIKIVDIVNVLDNYDVEFSSFVFHLKKLLMKFIDDGVKVSGAVCPSCKKSDAIIYESGCKMCTNCSWSACG